MPILHLQVFIVDLFSILFYVLFFYAAEYIMKPSGTFAKTSANQNVFTREVLKIVPSGFTK